MLKKNKWGLIFSSVVVVLPILIGLMLWQKLPESIPIHFNANGEADGWGSKAFAVFGLPVFCLAVHWLCVLFTAIDPKKKNIEGKPFGMVLWICPLISLLCSSVIYAFALDMALNINLIVILVFGLMFVAIGNYLPKCKQNYSIGIKVPWALNDEENWNYTHRLAGKLWVAGGVIIIATAFLEQIWIFAALTMVMAIIPIIASYCYYKNHLKDK